MSEHVISHVIDVSNLNVTPPSLAKVHGKAFANFVAEAEYDGIEATVFRSPVMRRMLGGNAARLVNALHAPFVGRTFTSAVFDTLHHPKDSYRNARGLGMSALMPEVAHGTAAMVKYQERLGKGPLDAVLYPQSGDSHTPLVFDNETAPFKSRSFQMTADVLHRWGVNMRPDAETPEQIIQMRVAMAKYGFNAVTLDGLHARREYPVEIDGKQREIGLSDEFIEGVIRSGLVKSFHVSVGRADLALDRVLRKQNDQEAELVRSENTNDFATTQQGEWLALALGSVGPGEFRTTFEQPGSLWMEDGKLTGGRHENIVNSIRSTRPL